jgi:hypothetical protein
MKLWIAADAQGSADLDFANYESMKAGRGAAMLSFH